MKLVDAQRRKDSDKAPSTMPSQMTFNEYGVGFPNSRTTSAILLIEKSGNVGYERKSACIASEARVVTENLFMKTGMRRETPSWRVS